MPNPDLQNYIAQSRQQGLTDDQIRQNLVGQGWKEVDIDHALSKQTVNAIPVYVYLIAGILCFLILFYNYFLNYQYFTEPFSVFSSQHPSFDGSSNGFAIIGLELLLTIYGIAGFIIAFVAKSLKTRLLLRVILILLCLISFTSFYWGSKIDSYIQVVRTQ